MCIIMILRGGNYRILLPVSVKNVPSILQDICLHPNAERYLKTNR